MLNELICDKLVANNWNLLLLKFELEETPKFRTLAKESWKSRQYFEELEIRNNPNMRSEIDLRVLWRAQTHLEGLIKIQTKNNGAERKRTKWKRTKNRNQRTKDEGVMVLDDSKSKSKTKWKNIGSELNNNNRFLLLLFFELENHFCGSIIHLVNLKNIKYEKVKHKKQTKYLKRILPLHPHRRSADPSHTHSFLFSFWKHFQATKLKQKKTKQEEKKTSNDEVRRTITVQGYFDKSLCQTSQFHSEILFLSSLPYRSSIWVI